VEPPHGVRGLAFFGFPLHPAGKPADERGAHLSQIAVPMLFLQGSKDTLAELSLLEPLVRKLGHKATLHVVDGADHSFHVPARSGRRDADVLADILDTLAAWANKLVKG
jgi:predicted alpha/beta-hydrolase family hydrolase